MSKSLGLGSLLRVKTIFSKIPRSGGNHTKDGTETGKPNKNLNF